MELKNNFKIHSGNQNGIMAPIVISVYPPPREIPLEIVIPQDPRKPKASIDNHHENDLVLPSFWRDTVLKAAIEKNCARNTAGSFKRSNSLVHQRLLEKTLCLSMVENANPDDNLFPNPPKSVASPQLASHSKSDDSLPSDDDDCFTGFNPNDFKSSGINDYFDTASSSVDEVVEGR